VENVVINPYFWKDKKVLVTGHTGFKGSWLCLWLQQLGAEVTGFSLEPATTPSLFNLAQVSKGMDSIYGDIRNLLDLKQTFFTTQPDIVIHMAAQALVRNSYRHPIETYQTNVMGTLHVLEGIRFSESVKAAVMVTTDKCYDNKEKLIPYCENEPMGGDDPYSSSKGCAELLIASYRNSYFTSNHLAAIASARAGNVIGGGDWSEDRLIPDIFKASKEGRVLKIRNPDAVRPWQHVLEPLSGYLLLAEKLYTQGSKFAEPWNFGPKIEDAKPVDWIVEQIARQWPGIRWEIDGKEHLHESKILTLDSTKANHLLSWNTLWSITEALQKIIDWYKAEQDGQNMKQVCLEQIEQFVWQDKLMHRQYKIG
jgi:CDP-glucose 4,6-dehydratase